MVVDAGLPLLHTVLWSGFGLAIVVEAVGGLLRPPDERCDGAQLRRMLRRGAA